MSPYEDAPRFLLLAQPTKLGDGAAQYLWVELVEVDVERLDDVALGDEVGHMARGVADEDPGHALAHEDARGVEERRAVKEHHRRTLPTHQRLPDTSERCEQRNRHRKAPIENSVSTSAASLPSGAEQRTGPEQTASHALGAPGALRGACSTSAAFHSTHSTV
eukprot:2576524-Pleurochrysis_carterae.AAC.4